MKEGEGKPKNKNCVLIDPPIIVESGTNPDMLGCHYALLRKMRVGKAYEELGLKVDVGFRVQQDEGGNDIVIVYEIHN